MYTLPTVHIQQLSKNLFIMRSNDFQLLYSPLQEVCVEINNVHGLELLQDYYLKGITNPLLEKFLEESGFFKKYKIPQTRENQPYYTRNIVLPLTSDCNLRCDYCYACAGELHLSNSWQVIKLCIDSAVNSAKRTKQSFVKLLFHGGGEAIFRWKLLVKSVEYLKHIWKGEIRLSVVTNGTLIDRTRAQWLKENNFRVSVSLDGPRDVHDAHRVKINGEGSFDNCMRGLLLLQKYKVNFGIRATITKESVDRMIEMVLIAKALNCGIKLEPLTITGRAEENNIPLDYAYYYLKFQEAKDVAKQLNVHITSIFFHKLQPRGEFCAGNGGMFCLTPENKISSCTRVTRTIDSLADQFIIGEIKDGQIVVDEEKIQNLKQLNINNFYQCQNCPAKWHCVGGCHHARLSNMGQMPQEYCDLMKVILFDLLREKLESYQKGGND